MTFFDARACLVERAGLGAGELAAIEHALRIDAAGPLGGWFCSMSHDIDMVQVARRVLQENGFAPDFAPDIASKLPPRDPDEPAQDLRALPWSSIDNTESRDLDQIEVAERAGDAIRVRVGIADVDLLVPKGSAIDRAAAANATSLYTGVRVFPMLPDVLSTNRTSLLEDEHPRYAVITDFVVRADGSLDDERTQIYAARVTNHAKLAYDPVGAWLEGAGERPHGGAVIADQLRLQDEVAQRLRTLRHQHGALELETIEARAVTEDSHVVDLQIARKNRARDLIEDLMIAANGATARFLEERGRSSIRRVVERPKRWDRIVELAASLGAKLPNEPDAKALAEFLAARRRADPNRFADLSLSVVKLMGPGEYALQRASDADRGHFGLAVDDYAHSTAPNRRYPDLVTQRLLKACAADAPAPYSDDELAQIAAHCTERENAARKVERTMRKVAAAEFLSSRIGETFDAIVTGVTDKGVFARLLHPPAEGRIVRGEHGLDVGDAVKVVLLATDPSRGFIDLGRR